MTIAALLKHKAAGVQAVIAVAPNDKVSAIVEVLAGRGIGAVLVREGETVVGILSERDVVRQLASHGAATLEMTADQLMTRGPRTAAPHTTIEEAMAMMTAGRFRHLPVMDGGRLVGLVSIGDVVKSRIEQQAAEVDNLKAYVAGFA